MATYYLDPTATGLDNGTTETDAWTTLQRAVDGTNGTQPTAGDTVLCKCGSGVQETLTTAVDINTSALSGTTSAQVKFVAVNSSWVNDWVDRYTLDGNDVATNCLLGGVDADYTTWEGFEFTQAVADGVSWTATSGGYGNEFINCSFNNCGNSGMYGYRNSYGLYQHCIAYSNGERGFDLVSGAILFCRAYSNGYSGFSAPYASYSIMYGCLAYQNTRWGIESISGGCPVVNCVVHDNGYDGISIYIDHATLIGNRITLNDTVGRFGIDCSDESAHLLGNYFQGNDGNIEGQLGDPLIKIIDVDTNQYDQGDTNYGYNSPSTGDFNLTSAATMRDVEIELP